MNLYEGTVKLEAEGDIIIVSVADCSEKTLDSWQSNSQFWYVISEFRSLFLIPKEYDQGDEGPCRQLVDRSHSVCQTVFWW